MCKKSCSVFSAMKKDFRKSRKPFYLLAQRKGFEPLYTFLHNTISNRARSTAPPSLHHSYYILSRKKNQLFLTCFQRFSALIFRFRFSACKRNAKIVDSFRSSLPCLLHFIPLLPYAPLAAGFPHRPSHSRFPESLKKSAAHGKLRAPLYRHSAECFSRYALPCLFVQAAFSSAASAARFASSFLFLKYIANAVRIMQRLMI